MLLLLLAVCAWYAVVGGEQVTVYRNVEPSPAKEYESCPGADVRLYIIKDNVLYLRYDTRRRVSFLLAVFRTPEKWDANKLADMLSEHPELKDMVPDQEAANLGIQWIQTGQ